MEEIFKSLGYNEIEVLQQGATSLNETHVILADGKKYFVKTHSSAPLQMYQSEARALELLLKTIRAPRPIHFGVFEGGVYLILEHIELFPHNYESQTRLGEALAKLHLKKGAKKFGFEVDNTIGTTLQSNRWHADWVTFFQKERLIPQLKMVFESYQDREVLSLGEKLIERLPQYFEGIEVRPALLHGDLWAGNSGRDRLNQPVIFDPASYYGHSEADLGIMANI